MRFVRMAGVLVAVSMLLPAPALAQDEDGVFIDPDSPSAKQYSIPLEQERRQADPEHEPDAGVQQGERSSPLFGAGIDDSDERSTPARRSRKPDAGSRKEENRSRQEAARSSEPPERESRDREIVEAAASNPGPPGGGVGVALTIAGVAIAVLLVGGAAGLLLRRRA